MANGALTILHVEDDPLLAGVVKSAFQRFGFQGDTISAGSVSAAVRLLDERTRDHKPVSLIITDLRLPDGTGLDLIREVKMDPVWRMTPVIVLSHHVKDGIITDAYALGASSYIPKISAWNNLLGSLQNMYQYWLENAVLPRGASRDRLQESLERAIALRTRTAEFYLRLAHASQGAPEESSFWLDRALNEGNLSNLLAFFRNRVHEKDAPPGMADRLTNMQAKVRDALRAGEDRLTAPRAAPPDMVCQSAIEIAESLEEEVFAEALGILFPVSSVATTALKVRAAAQMEDLASFILERTKDQHLRRKATALFDWSRRLGSDLAQKDRRSDNAVLS